jgi:hypothetical protein
MERLDRQVVPDFHQMTQAERLQDKNTNLGAKQVAAIAMDRE